MLDEDVQVFRHFEAGDGKFPAGNFAVVHKGQRTNSCYLASIIMLCARFILLYYDAL
jgi:hypothetical protein